MRASLAGAASRYRLAILFAVSGASALIYQIAWQRALFTGFGVNIESVTIIVSVFMFGLGVGALVGGALSARFPESGPTIFLVCELAVGLFGAVSLPLIRVVTRLTLHGSLFTVAAVAYALISLPTIFMGATLPILVAHLHRRYASVARTVATLYFFNTAGSALACFLTVDVLFVLGGLQAAVFFACVCNVLVGVLVYRTIRRGPPTDPAPPAPAKPARARPSETEEPSETEKPSETEEAWVRFLLACLLSAAVGYVALSQEIVWFRVVGYLTGGRPDVFGHVLGFLLAGVAVGAIAFDAMRARSRAPLSVLVAAMLVASGALYACSVPAIAACATHSGPLAVWVAYASVFVVALASGSVFPALCHWGAPPEAAVGARVSWIYFANIVGSAAGPLLTGFVLLQRHDLQRMVLGLGVAECSLAALVLLFAPIAPIARVTAFGAIAATVAGGLAVQREAFDGLLEKLQYKARYAQARDAGGRRYKYVLQNRSGIIAVEEGHPSDTVYGGGVYDGTFNVDPAHDTNGIDRAYLLGTFHPDPREVLEIGLSTGSWARVLASDTRTRHVTVVEINAGYRDLIARYDEAAPLLHDPKVTIEDDDGRRWLNRHPDRKFDVILMNASFHWRDEMTNLLSVEALRLYKAHLNEGGTLYYNTTMSEDSVYSAALVFRHVVRYRSFAAASDRPLAETFEEKRRALLAFEQGGRPVFDESDPGLRALLEKLARIEPVDQGDSLRKAKGLWEVTDDDMVTEFRRFVRAPL